MGIAETRHQYQAIAKNLRDQIVRGDFNGGGRLPSERSLVQSFQVQRNTVRQALALLESEGWISTEGKRGSFVRNPDPVVSRRAFLMNIHGGTSPNLRQLADGFGDVSQRAGFSVRRFNTDPPVGGALDTLPDIDSLAPDTAGVMLWPQNPTDAERLTQVNSRMPLVLVDRRVLGVSVDCVRFDDIAGGKMVCDHLLDIGHRRIAFLTDEVFAETVQHRWHGYALAHEERDLPLDPRHSLFFHGLHEPFFSSAMRALVSLGDLAPTAIICSNDLVAFTLLRYLRDEGIKVPDDMSVTGYGNSIPDYAEAMALTSVDQPFFELGQMAAATLLDRLEESSEARIRNPRDLTIPVRLVVRKSTAAI